jgi:hypothetical protein
MRIHLFHLEADMRITCFPLLVALACLLAVPAGAGNPERVGTAGGGELQVPVSARGIALGNGVMADIEGVEAMYYNPAGLSGLGGAEVYFSHVGYIADMKKNYFAGAIKTAYGAFGVTVDVFSVGEIEETTEAKPDGTGRTFSPTFAVVGGTYSQFLTDAVSVGVTAKMVNESILDVSAVGVAFDFGLQYRPSWRNLRVGIALKDFGSQMRFDGDGFETSHTVSGNPTANPHILRSQSSSFELPSTFQVGMVYRVLDRGDNRISGYGSFMNNNFGRDEYHLGAEYSFRSMLSLRGSYVANGSSDNNFGPSFGVGLKVPVGSTNSAQFDYAIRTVPDYFDNVQVFSVKFAF